MPPKTPNSPKTRSWGTDREETRNYTADRSERELPIEVKQFSNVCGEFQEDVTHQMMTLMRPMISEHREGTNTRQVKLKQDTKT